MAQRMTQLYQTNAMARAILAIDIHRAPEIAVKKLLRGKKEAFSTPIGTGVDFVFPFWSVHNRSLLKQKLGLRTRNSAYRT